MRWQRLEHGTLRFAGSGEGGTQQEVMVCWRPILLNQLMTSRVVSVPYSCAVKTRKIGSTTTMNFVGHGDFEEPEAGCEEL
ncbi:hypothetical protein LWI29_009708 [Acer saccharum]|uniref:Uncharacterized protein n=1 Tax=Acer saccharum TaxID=4024 RepID=A0AA39RHB9_ACESA|nr:hypothetical protein LWI29_009708 [Acer saccharum]